MDPTRPRRKYDRLFKLDTVRLVTEGGEPVAAIACEVGIDADRLHHWKRPFSYHGMSAFTANSHLKPDDAERRPLEREIATLREKNTILKKRCRYPRDF